MLMKTLGFLVALLVATLPMQIKAEPMLLSLNAEQLRDLELDGIPPWPDEIVLSDSEAYAYLDAAIDAGWRAVEEQILTKRKVG